jgi:ribosomal protein S18 acetylase RimI-like enzyme
MLENLRYIKRYRMERSLTEAITVPSLPEGFSWLAWEDNLLDLHAQVQHLCFSKGPDVEVFPSFATLGGCKGVLSCIRNKDGFCPSASWLLMHGSEPVGTVQGISDAPRVAALQNLGVCPSHRRQGLGDALLRQALAGFQRVGMVQVYLEVTAKNFAAIQLYRSHGFRCTRTIYKPILVSEPSYAGSGI